MYLRRQSRPVDLWVVVDDVHPETTSDLGADIRLRPDPLWHPRGGHTVVRNFVEGVLEILKTDCEIITIFEDDDWYSPWYIDGMARVLETRYADGTLLVGERHMLYYNARDRSWFRNFNPCHASLCTVSFHRDLADKAIEIAESGNGGPFIDVRLWRKTQPNQKWLTNTDLCVGIKGIPTSRAGVTRAHRGFNSNYTPDPDLSMLRQFIGDDADLYAQCFNPVQTPEELRAQQPTRETPRQRRRMLQGKALEIANARRRRR
jgi:hypothetical protein